MQRHTAGRQAFVIFAQPSALPQPTEGPFQDPAFGRRHAAVSIVATFDDTKPSRWAIRARRSRVYLPSAAIYRHTQDQLQAVDDQETLAIKSFLNRFITVDPFFHRAWDLTDCKPIAPTSGVSCLPGGGPWPVGRRGSVARCRRHGN